MKNLITSFLTMIGTAILIAAQTPAGKTATNWQQLVSEKNNFRIMLPSKSIESTEIVETEIGRVPINTFVASAEPNYFTVMVAEYPISFDTIDSAKGVIEAGIGSMASKMKLESNYEQKEIFYGKYPGREIKAPVMNGVMNMRAYVINNRMYMLILVTNKAPLSPLPSNESRQFFDSFTLLKSPDDLALNAPPVSKIESSEHNSSGPPPSFYTQPVLWRDFKQSEFGFSVRLPGEPYKETVKLNPNDPRLDMHTWMAKGEGSLIYQVAFQQLLAVPEDSEGVKLVIENLRDGLAEGIEGKVISEKQITINGYPGREIKMKSADLRAIGRLYLVGSRVYILNILTASGDVAQKDAGEFFDSLKLTLMPNAVSATSGTVVETAIWREVAEPELGFIVMMPVQPTEEFKQIKDLKIKMLMAKGDGILCVAAHMFVPAPLPSTAALNQFFHGFSQGFANSLKAEIVGEKTISFDGHPGREYLLKNDLLSGICRIYMVNGNVYMLISMPTLTDSGDKAMNKFFESFKLTQNNKDQAPPPPPPMPANAQPGGVPLPKKINVSGGVLQAGAIKKVQPIYPAEAKAQRVQGSVEIQILVSEDGNVIEASVISGPELLRDVALEAAREWKFKPTELSGVPVKIQGVLTFNFTLR